jgi:DNA-directed RNA polymerase specialized sigma24 family protein
MYDHETVRRLLPGVCWTHHLSTTRDTKGRKGHVCTRDDSFWAAPPAPEVKSSVDPAQYRDVDWPTHDDIDQMDDREQKRWRGRIERAVEPSKRKSFNNPKTSNDVWAELIDVQIGWDSAALTLKERQALLMAYGLKMSVTEIADHYGVSHALISNRVSTAVDKIVARLDGGYWHELEAVEA